jgi:hypothetical protein
VPSGLRHVLVAEADSPIRAMLADLLLDASYAAAEAIDGFLSEPFDLDVLSVLLRSFVLPAGGTVLQA